MGTLKSILVFLLLSSPLWATTYQTDSDPTPAEVQALIDGAVDGDIIEIAAGSFSWSTGVTVSGKGITIRGQGGGGILGFSQSLNAFTTGSKDFIFYQPSSLVWYREPVVGESLTFYYPVRNENDSLIGTVTAWDPGTRTITVNITTVNGVGGTRSDTDAGDEDMWIVYRQPTTEISYEDTGGTTTAITINEDTTHSVYLKDLRIRVNADEGLQVNDTTGGKPVVVSGVTFYNLNDSRSVEWISNQGLLYDCSFHVAWNSENGTSSQSAMKVYNFDDTNWTTGSTLGVLDTDGLSKVYVEDCMSHGHRDTWVDMEENSRLCIRNSVFAECGIGGHSLGSGDTNGLREFEYYSNAHLHQDDGSGREFNIGHHIGPRGGTGAIHSSYFESVGTGFGTPSSFKARTFTLMNKGGEAGTYSYGDGEVTYPSVDHPIPQGVGVGYVDGSNGTFIGSSSGAARQIGEVDPVWIWNISGTNITFTNSGLSRFNANAPYLTISASEWSDSGGDLLLTETGSLTWNPTVNNAGVYFDAGSGTLPTGLSEGTRYYAIDIDGVNGVWKFSATSGGAAIAYTDSGTGTTMKLSAADNYTAYVTFDLDGDTVEEGEVVAHQTDVPKPGYEAYPYPHWLQGESVGTAYGGRLRFNGTGSQPVLTDQTGSVPIKTN